MANDCLGAAFFGGSWSATDASPFIHLRSHFMSHQQDLVLRDRLRVEGMESIKWAVKDRHRDRFNVNDVMLELELGTVNGLVKRSSVTDGR